MSVQPMQPAICTERHVAYVAVDPTEAFGCCMRGYFCGEAVRLHLILAALTLLAYLSDMILMCEHC